MRRAPQVVRYGPDLHDAASPGTPLFDLRAAEEMAAAGSLQAQHAASGAGGLDGGRCRPGTRSEGASGGGVSVPGSEIDGGGSDSEWPRHSLLSALNGPDFFMLYSLAAVLNYSISPPLSLAPCPSATTF